MAGNSIAILPFVNLSNDPEQDYFGEGLAEEIINALTKIDGLLVTARTSSFAFKGRAMDIRKIGQQLGVANVLEGSIRVVGQRVRITAQLIHVEDGFHLWSDNFDRLLDDIFAVQDEISLLIADKIREHSSHFEIADHLVTIPQVPAAVYQDYLRARHLVHKLNRDDVQKGIGILENLTEAYPHFAAPFLQLCFAYTFMGGFGVLPASYAFARSRSFLSRVPAIEKQSPEYLLRLAGLAYWQDWNLPEALDYLEQVLRQQPGNAEAHLWMGVCLATIGRFDTAHAALDRAMLLDPFSVLIHDFKGVTHYFAGEYEEAIAYFRRCLALDPNFHMSHINWAAAELMQGKLQAGLQRFQNLPPSGQGDLSILGGTLLAKAMQGDLQEVYAKLPLLEAALDTEVGDRAYFFLILIYTTLNQHEKALSLLEEAVRSRMSMLIALPVEPFVKPLHAYPVFQQIVGQLKQLPEQEHATQAEKAPLTNSADMDALDQLMCTQQPYLDPQLSLRKLAALAGHHPNYLSRLINECTGKNFAEYTNTYRLQAFARSAEDPAKQQLTLLALAYECGFNSKTVFNTFCKKATGLTPGAYWKSLCQ